MERVGINAHLLAGEAGYRQAGIHHYIKQVLNHLPQDNGLTYTVYGGKGAGVHLTRGLTFQASKITTTNPISRIAWEQGAWPLLARKDRLNLLHSMAFVTPVASRVPKVVTVFDLSFMYHPDRYTRFKRLYLQTQTRRSCTNAQRVVTISEFGRKDVHQLFGVAWEKIDVVEPGVDEMYRVLPHQEVERFKRENKLNKPFLLHVGTLQPRKNIPTLIQAFAHYNDPELDLVLVGGKGWLYDDIFASVEALGLKNNVRFTGYVADDDLPLWYNAAKAFVFPSVYEGFGMPVAAAMACGTPVIVSNASSLPEVAGKAGLLFDPHDVGALTGCLKDVLQNPTLANTMRENGLLQARKFSWIQAGVKMVNCYQKALHVASP